MTENQDIVLAIVSDMHCHEATPSPQESWLLVGARRRPAGDHPVQALISLIAEHSLHATAVICPGDLANKVSSPGMVQSWSHLKEIQRELKAKLLLTTLGNHDVDCVKRTNPDPFHVPRMIGDDFPVGTPTQQASFWTNGFYFSKGPNGSEFLVLNTVIGHHDETSAKRGTFDLDRILKLDEALKDREKGRREIRYKIAVMHHHPLLHSSGRFASTDVLEFGDKLLSVLSRHGYQFVIHGHKHEPRISRQSSASGNYFVFASGSFSAWLAELSTWTRNLFHMVKLGRCSNGDQIQGELLSWEYHKGMGWLPSTETSAALPHNTRFSSTRPEISIEQIASECGKAPGQLLRSDEILSRFPEMQLLLPSELMELKEQLRKKGLKLVVTEHGEIDTVGKT